VGTDRNIHDWILERRADILESLLKFFHCDLVQILESLNNDRNRFTEKLYQMFETYLPILQHNANLFSNIPVIKLPKVSADNIKCKNKMLQEENMPNINMNIETIIDIILYIFSCNKSVFLLM